MTSFCVQFSNTDPSSSEGILLRFDRLVHSDGSARGQIDGAHWKQRPVLLHPMPPAAKDAAARSLASLTYRPSAAPWPSTPPTAIPFGASLPARAARSDPPPPSLAWACNRCGIVREPDSPDPARCARLQTFLDSTCGGGAAPADPSSFYSRFRPRDACGRPLCGLTPRQHFRAGAALLCPRFYDCCRCLAAAGLGFRTAADGCASCRAPALRHPAPAPAQPRDGEAEDGEEEGEEEVEGELTLEAEEEGVLRDLFAAVDTDGDGAVTPAELRAALARSGEGRAALLRAARGALAHIARLEAQRAGLADVLLAALPAADRAASPARRRPPAADEPPTGDGGAAGPAGGGGGGGGRRSASTRSRRRRAGCCAYGARARCGRGGR